ncbi:MAG: hypothetical protein ABI164_08050, partial [Acidobacteriaceae bacterium]
MPKGLARYPHTGDLHFITFSCYRRQQFPGSASARELFVRSLERMRIRYEFFVTRYGQQHCENESNNNPTSQKRDAGHP